VKPSFDEMRADARTVREHYRGYDRWLAQQPGDVMLSRREEAEVIFRRVGITFAVYGAKDEEANSQNAQNSGSERLIPFDLIPRVIPAHEWAELERGLAQRVRALNRFIDDIYHGQQIIKAGHVPAEQILGNAKFRPEMMGVDVPRGVYSHISGIDIVRAAEADGSGRYYVLEDNLRVPSGVSYMLEDRKMILVILSLVAITAAQATAEATVEEAAAPGAAENDRGQRQRFSPAVRRLAEEHGLDPSVIKGSGEGGRVTRDDVLAYVDAQRRPSDAA